MGNEKFLTVSVSIIYNLLRNRQHGKGRALAATTQHLNVSVWRQSPGGVGGSEAGWQDFEVPAHSSQTVLDVVTWIQQNEDPSLSYRFACRVGMCGSCAMMVNDVPRWTCRTHVGRVARGGRLKIGPLRNLPVIRDLVVDMDPFFDKWVAAGGVHSPSRGRQDPVAPVDPASAARTEADAAIECINCAVCYAACDTVAGNPDYLGPAALQRVWTLANDERHAGQGRAVDTVSGRGGCHGCHSMGSCTQYCPNLLDPMRAIAGLKRQSAARFWKGRRDD